MSGNLLYRWIINFPVTRTFERENYGGNGKACLWAVADVEETTTPNHLIIVDEDQDQHHGSLLTPLVLYSNFSYLKNQPYDKRQLLCHLHITYDLGSPHH
ncbi:hypothetical protein ES332_A11G387000v1 [Gossypium tomentosum]|uniref:Uncharacterized protein n=1 Tax=Gossypium tomentosum TaxID=34277 RepID=A0A5D2NLJ6_GOSTO|nr:hypothetical protein ES332_A11G387000v1 [Gossypium tomentosum]